MARNVGIVLVVDDDPEIRGLVEMVLQSEFGVVTVLAEDGQDALDRLGGVQPSMIVTDVRMPRVDGVELVRRLRASPDTERTPILVVAASTSARDAAMAAGGDDYLDKPFDIDALATKASHYLSG